MTSGAVVVLAGGTGGAKLARGLLDHAGSDLVVLANPGDDVEAHGAHVAPDADLVTFWLADRIDARGWGLADDTFAAMDMLRELGDDVWFNLGDRDLALCLRRARRLAEGATMTEVLAEHATSLGVTARVLPPSDEPVRTLVQADDRWWDFQEFMIRRLRMPPEPVVQDVRFVGAEDAQATPDALAAIGTARAIVVGPSNPVISIRPILSVPGIADAIRASPAPVVAVAPFVRGAVVKGPTASFLHWAGVSADALGTARYYGDLLDGLVTDELIPSPDGLALRVTDTLLGDPDARRRVAGEVLAFADELRTTTEATA